jgi:hypothetical protein
MTAKLVIIAFGALALMVNGANAQHRTNGHSQVRHVSRTFGQAYGYVPGAASVYQSPGGIYESNSQGSQSYPNPDRGPYPTPCGSCRL